jgi:hypothetical protein
MTSFPASRVLHILENLSSFIRPPKKLDIEQKVYISELCRPALSKLVLLISSRYKDTPQHFVGAGIIAKDTSPVKEAE